jgi:hypothetical protein
LIAIIDNLQSLKSLIYNEGSMILNHVQSPLPLWELYRYLGRYLALLQIYLEKPKYHLGAF